METKTAEAYQAEALEAVKTEHANYFDALNKHPRMLVGTEVPRIGGEGMEVLRDAEDAKDWQDAVKHLLVDEVRSRASKAMDENSDFLTTVHASIALFQNNPDLVPGTKEFDVDLANRFAAMAEPYELRVDGKLHGYSIPVQPLLDRLRTQVATERQAAAAPAPATPAAPAAPSPAAGTAPAAAEPPQAGIASKAGGGADPGEDFSTLFGTIGLPNLRI